MIFFLKLLALEYMILWNFLFIFAEKIEILFNLKM